MKLDARTRFQKAKQKLFGKPPSVVVKKKQKKSTSKVITKIKEHPVNRAKILFFDIETAPVRGWVWRAYEDNLLKTDKDWYMLSFAYRWAHQDEVKVCALPDYHSFKTDKENDHDLCKALWKLFDEADIIVAHNGDAFDVKKANARFIIHGMEPPSFYKTIDTLKIARRYFKFTSNKLNELGNYLNLGEKLPHTGMHLWFGCMNGDPDSWKLMKEYNVQDVRLLMKVYYRIASWHTSHPNLNLYTDTHEDGCPKCQSMKVVKRGFKFAATTKRQQFKCNDCGGWFSGGPPIKKPDILLQSALTRLYNSK